MIFQILFASFIISASGQPDSTRPIVPMKDYKNEFRILDCQDCFNAGGRMCHNKDYTSMIQLTKSSDTSMGICCKPDASTGFCAADNGAQVCSMKAQDDSSSKYKDVLTSGSSNYQMFAFCPLDGATKCGVSKKTATGVPDTDLLATKGKQTVKSDEMKLVEGASSVRRHDTCHYMIKMSADVDKAKLPTGAKLHFYLNLGVNMNVHVYEGETRLTATKSLVKGNTQALVQVNYEVSPDSGLLVIAYPKKDLATRFEFNYWVGTSTVPPASDDMMDQEEDTLTMFIVGAACFAFLLIMVIVACCVIRSQQKIEQSKVQNNNTVDYDFEMKGGFNSVTPKPTPRLDQLDKKSEDAGMDGQTTGSHLKQGGEEKLLTDASNTSIFNKQKDGNDLTNPKKPAVKPAGNGEKQALVPGVKSPGGKKQNNNKAAVGAKK